MEESESQSISLNQCESNEDKENQPGQDQSDPNQPPPLQSSTNLEPLGAKDPTKCPFSLREHIDCKDTEDKWLNAEIIAISGKKVHVHYSGFSDRWNEWIQWDSPRLLKQWRPGRLFQINNRIDVIDTQNKWLEAFVIEIKEEGKVIRVHYKGFTAKWEEDLPIDSDRIAQIGYHSKAYGSGRKLRPGNLATENEENTQDSEELTKQRNARKEKEDQFRDDLDAVGLRIISIGADGNCMFRALSHQVYGTEDHFKYIRRRTMDYCQKEKLYFKDFVPDEYNSVDEYIEHHRMNGVWGDNLELQILSELYS
mmetsp:Transcript_1526/g.1480  ORF Transcript_1526/g.1480 Transcript_1526/m.1480 type:complete len:310 (+) Transcript_1526:1-930(+)